MHELALAENVLAIVEATARRHAAERVRAIRLEIGSLACVETEALRFCFDAVTRGTIAESSHLEIETTPGAAWCMRCGDRVPLRSLGDACPLCGSYQLQVIGGEELRVKDIVVA